MPRAANQRRWRQLAPGVPNRQRTIVVMEVFAKKTGVTPKAVIAACRKRLQEYDNAGN
jgi:phage-related protein